MTISHAIDGKTAVARLLGADGGIGSVWGKKTAVIRGSGLIGLLPTEDEILATPLLRPPYLTVMIDGEVVPQAPYLRTESISNHAPPENFFARAPLEEALAAGAAFKLNRMELWSPPVTALADAIGDITRKKVKVWGFLSPHAQKMVPYHRDPAHVIACQVAGRKRWSLGGPAPAGSWSGMKQVDPVHEEIVDLETGEVLYMPYGYAHCAAAETSSSFHISFALEGTTVGELRHRVVKYLADTLDGVDATEVNEENLPVHAADLHDALLGLAARVRDLPKRDLTEVYAGNTAAVINSLLD
ncbi:JmjC domain-containing protein [Kribbella sp. NPDC004138]